MSHYSVQVRQNCDRSYMDSTSLAAKTNRSVTCVCVHESLANLTERFDERNNVPDWRSPYGWKKRVGIRSKRKWLSTSLPDVWEGAPVLWWDILWTPLRSTCKRKTTVIRSTTATGTAFERYSLKNR
ncbi:hypothetical protein ANTRET_LOCUS9800 [Anthophora retusa]